MGHKGGHTLYRSISCNEFVPDIDTPVFVLTAKDDPITKYKSVPVFDIRRNPNMFLIATPYGGHCEFNYRKIDEATGKSYLGNYVENLAFAYFDRVRQFKEIEKSTAAKL